jgi:hypothetical protein
VVGGTSHLKEEIMETICFVYKDKLGFVTIDPTTGDVFDAKLVFDRLVSEGFKVTILVADEIVTTLETPYITEHIGIDVTRKFMCDPPTAKIIYDKLISYKPHDGYFAIYSNEQILNTQEDLNV